MKRVIQGPDGQDWEEDIDVEPRVPGIEDVTRKNHGLAGPNEYVKTYLDTHETAAERSKRAPSEGHFTVEVDPHWSELRLPDHPRGEGWIKPDPSKPTFPEEK
jgi:hypothetical protein